MLLEIVIPAHNEADTLGELIDRIRCVRLPAGWDLRMIVVDDGSTDATPVVIASRAGEDLQVIRHNQAQGKGAAVRAGFGLCRGDAVIIQDADLEYDPNDYGALLEPIIAGRALAVYGDRFAQGRPAGMSRAYYVGNLLLTWLTNCLYGCRLNDMETCYKLMARDVFSRLELVSDGFEIEPELTVAIVKQGVAIEQVPVKYAARSRAQGKKIRARDGLRALFVLLQRRQ